MIKASPHSASQDRLAALECQLQVLRAEHERLQAEHATLLSQFTGEARYRAIIESIPEGYFETDLEGNFIFCNLVFAQISGYASEELIGTNFRVFTPPRTVRAMQASFGRLLKTGQEVKLASFEVFHKAGHTLTTELTAALIKDPTGAPIGYVGIMRDVSERVKTSEKQRRLQTQQQHAQKMEALGTLAGGIAHGFNNVLMAIQGNISLIRMNLPPQHALQKHLERIDLSTEKGVHLAKQILSFAKMGKFVVMSTNLNRILKSTSRMFVRSMPDLKIHELYQEVLWETRVDRVQIGQALLGLYMNAAEAMSGTGDLYLQSENVFLDEHYVRPYNITPGRYVKISITDSGQGLDEEAKRRVFEPFFSTHRPGRYDGMGLAAVYGTIKSHSGIINVYSEKGHGATFTIYLPASKKERIPATDLQEITEHHETVLMVEDDEAAAYSGREVLERLGYRAMTAASGAEAIDVYAAYQDRIQLVLLDIILPDISAEQVLEALRKRNPKVLVILTSGYNINKRISAMLQMGCAAFIQKPFQVQTLSAKVRAALDGLVADAAISWSAS